MLAIRSKIYEVRGQRVMLDFDLASMYGVETRALNQSVKRNIERFPEDFMFQLTKDELDVLKSQIVTSSWGGTRKLPYAFTEMGVAMLSSVLRSPLAIQVNIGIMRAFTEFRRMAVALPLSDDNRELRAEIQVLRDEMNDMLNIQNEINEDTRAQLDAISEALAELQPREPSTYKRRRIGFYTDGEQK
ncbi:MAG: ORF6N domain-containing protein [Bacteroidaceae bacterium]|nr:ORF6N domain-containing protein [Bacteroidaceae bacterium]